MGLQLLDFDCSEDTEGVVCWDALAAPQPQHHSALLQEVSAVLAWAYRFDAQGPGPLEDGAHWDYDLQASLHAPGQIPHSVPIAFDPSTGQAQLTAGAWQAKVVSAAAPHTPWRLTLGLSLSGTPAFAQAFRAQWQAP
jgi:hypothetical protein